jgi:hypothetical protein
MYILHSYECKEDFFKMMYEESNGTVAVVYRQKEGDTILKEKKSEKQVEYHNSYYENDDEIFLPIQGQKRQTLKTKKRSNSTCLQQ